MRTSSKGLFAILAAATAASVITGCSSSGSDANGKISLTVGDFGTFGYKEAGLFKEYEAAHPNITIKEDTNTQEAAYWTALQTHLSGGGGYADVQAIEVGHIATATSDAMLGYFQDLSSASGVVKSDYLPWKWNQATVNGKTIGLGTDVGPMAICYRSDLFKAAGLPTDPTAVAALWAGDWQKYVDVGKQFQSAAPSGVSFMDSATGLFNGVVSSSAYQYYKDGKLAYKESPSVAKAWSLAMQADGAQESAGYKEFDPPWQQGFAKSTFATTVCPSWQQANIQQYGGAANAGKWNIAQAPAAGNWGGSFLSVPSGGKHVAEATALAVWLTQPAQQAKVFTAVGNIPSNQAAYALPSVTNATNAYLSNAPVGQIFTTAAKNIQPAEIGKSSGDLQTDFSTGILLVEQNHKSAADAWTQTLQTIDNALTQ